MAIVALVIMICCLEDEIKSETSLSTAAPEQTATPNRATPLRATPVTPVRVFRGSSRQSPITRSPIPIIFHTTRVSPFNPHDHTPGSIDPRTQEYYPVSKEDLPPTYSQSWGSDTFVARVHSARSARHRSASVITRHRRPHSTPSRLNFRSGSVSHA